MLRCRSTLLALAFLIASADLGENTEARVKSMTSPDPDKTWAKVEQ